jgi:hypothetical protein
MFIVITTLSPSTEQHNSPSSTRPPDKNPPWRHNSPWGDLRPRTRGSLLPGSSHPPSQQTKHVNASEIWTKCPVLSMTQVTYSSEVESAEREDGNDERPARNIHVTIPERATSSSHFLIFTSCLARIFSHSGKICRLTKRLLLKCQTLRPFMCPTSAALMLATRCPILMTLPNRRSS